MKNLKVSLQMTILMHFQNSSRSGQGDLIFL